VVRKGVAYVTVNVPQVCLSQVCWSCGAALRAKAMTPKVTHDKVTHGKWHLAIVVPSKTLLPSVFPEGWRLGWTELGAVTSRRLQIPPLRYATVGMTRGGRLLSGRVATRMDGGAFTLRRLRIPPLRSGMTSPTYAGANEGHPYRVVSYEGVLRRDLLLPPVLTQTLQAVSSPFD